MKNKEGKTSQADQSGKGKLFLPDFFRTIWKSIIKDPKGFIYMLMIAFMILATGAFWFGAAIRNKDNILVFLYCISIVITLVLRFTKLFSKDKTLIVTLITLTLIFLLAYLY